MRRPGSFSAFAEIELRDYLERRLVALRQEVAAESENYILNVDEAQYIEHLVSSFTLESIRLHVDQVEATTREVRVPAEHFSPLFHVQPGKSYPRTAIVYHLPFEGDAELLRCAPSSRLLWTVPVWITGGELCFESVDMSNNPEDLNREAERTLENLQRQSENVGREVVSYNSSLEAQARQTFAKRKEEIRSKQGFLSAIKVPLRKRDDLPETFAVLAPKPPRKIAMRPTASEKAFQPEPTVDESTYREILQVIYDVGKAFERLPATYSAKSEEELRDHVLLYLAPRFSGAATGETFNRGGKTDILLRYENTNVFVAEFKFWRGSRSVTRAASQLFSYLTWRDSKAALVIFVPIKAFSTAVDGARAALRSLENFVRENTSVAESWFDFVFHLPGDRSRSIRVALLLIHTPTE